MAICLLVPMPSLSRLLARSLFPAQSSSGLPADVSPLPPHRMNNELVKTARADRSSVKPFQFIPIPFRPRIGCRMMCSLAACPLRLVALVLPACRCLIRSAHPSRPSPRRACRASVLLSACSSRLACPIVLISRACPSRLIRSSASRIRLVHPPRSAYPPRSSCRRAGHPCVSLSSRHAFRLPSCVLIAVLHSARPREVIADVIASLMRSVATVPPLPRLARAVGCFSRRVLCYTVCRGDGDLRMGGIRASVSYATPPYAGGVVCFLLLSTWRPHSC